jgi:hypothetical protein
MVHTLPEISSSAQQLTLITEPAVPLTAYERSTLEALLVRAKHRLERAEAWRSKAIHECLTLRQRIAELVQRLNG